MVKFVLFIGLALGISAISAQNDYRPFYGGFEARQIVPPGQPWPASAEGYKNRNEIGLYYQNLYGNKRKKQKGAGSTTTVAPNPSSPIDVSQEKLSTTTEASTTSSIANQNDQVISLEYKPARPFYYSSNLYPSEIVPPGEPWPASAEGYKNRNEIGSYYQNLYGNKRKKQKGAGTTSTVAPNPSSPIDVSQEKFSTTTEANPTSSIANQNDQVINIEYKPTRPFYYPSNLYPSQIVPPGKPWPASQQEYETFGQNNNNKVTTTTTQAPITNLDNRNDNTNDEKKQSSTTRRPSSTNGISLEYKPSRPFYKPWPTTTTTVPPQRQRFDFEKFKKYFNSEEMSDSDLIFIEDLYGDAERLDADGKRGQHHHGHHRHNNEKTKQKVNYVPYLVPVYPPYSFVY